MNGTALAGFLLLLAVLLAATFFLLTGMLDAYLPDGVLS